MRRAITMVAGFSTVALLSCEEPKPAVPSAGVSASAGKATIALSHRAVPPAEPGAPWRLVIPGTGELEFQNFAVVISAVELHLCEERRAAAGRWSPRNWLIPAAYAHVPTSATRLGTPFVEDLLDGSRGARNVGEIGPPLGNYCRAFVIFAPADDDVVNLSGIDAEKLVFKTAFAAGRHRLEGEDEWTEFSWSSELAAPVEVDLRGAGDTPIRLQTPGDQAFILLDKTLASDYFQTLTPAQIQTGQAMELVLRRMFSSIKLQRFD